MFLWSAVWFVVLALDQFDEFVSGPRRNVLDLAQLLLVFGFPPLIVHTMYLEGHVRGVDRPGAGVGDPRARRHVHRLGAGASSRAMALVFGVVRVPAAGGWIGGAAGRALHRRPAVYSAMVMNRNPRAAPRRRSTARCGGC